MPVIASRASRRNDLGKRRRLAVGDPRITLRAAALLECRTEIGGHASHQARAKGLATRLLDRVEDRARQLAGGLPADVEPVVVVAQAQRHRIRFAAHDRDFVGGQIARRHRQPRIMAAQAGAFRRKGDGELGMMGDGAHRRAGHLPERLDRTVVLPGHISRRSASCAQWEW